MLQHCDDFGSYGQDTKGDIGNYGITSAVVMLKNVYGDVSNDVNSSSSNVKYLGAVIPDPVSGAALPCFCAQAVSPYDGPFPMNGARYVLSSAQKTVGVASRIYLDNLPVSADIWVYPSAFYDQDLNVIFQTRLLTTGQISVINAKGDIIATSAAPVVPAGKFVHIETKGVVDAVNGMVEVRVEGKLAVKATNINTGTTAISQVYGGSIWNKTQQVASYVYHKDLIIWDATGDYNNDFMGPCFVIPANLDAVVSNPWEVEGTEPDPIKFLKLSPPDEAKYLSGPVNVAPFTASVKALPENAISVKGLKIYSFAGKSDSGEAYLQQGLVSHPISGDPQTVVGASHSLSESAAFVSDVFEINPVTGVQWTPEEVHRAYLSLARLNS